MEYDDRPWGNYLVLLDDENCKVKKITVLPGQRPSYQYHHKRSETWAIIEGQAVVTLNDDTLHADPGDTIEVPLGCKHRIQNSSEVENLVFIEIQRGSYFGEDDIVRVEDDYKRS